MQSNVHLKHSNKKVLSTSYAPYVFYKDLHASRFFKHLRERKSV